MELDAFLSIVPHDQQAKMRPSTLEMWCRIYSYIEKQEFADTVDDFEFTAYVQAHKPISTSSIMANLRRMAECGLLAQHDLRMKGGHTGFIGSLIGGRNPTHMVRYTLPGKDVPLRSKMSEDDARAEAARMRLQEQERREGPKAVCTLDDVSHLLRWLESKRVEPPAITSEQNERLGKLVADASGILRTMDARIQKLYMSAAMRSNHDPRI